MKKVILSILVLISLAAQSQEKDHYGIYRIDSLHETLKSGTDTTALKPIGITSTGRKYRMGYWPGSGSSGTPAGNTGNIQINRNGVFSTPAGDSLNYNSSAGFVVKNTIVAQDDALAVDNTGYNRMIQLAVSGSTTRTGVVTLYSGTSSASKGSITLAPIPAGATSNKTLSLEWPSASIDTIANRAWVRSLGLGGGGTTTNVITFNNSGSGAASGTTFDGSTARTISYNTIGAMANPMTTANDIVIGGSSGTPTRLAVGGEGSSLTVSGGNIAWGTGTSWNGAYASSASGSLAGTTFGNTNSTLQIHTGGAGATTLPLVSGAYTKGLHFINQGSGTLTIQRQGTDQIFYHGANVTSFPLDVGQSCAVFLINSLWTVFFDGYNPNYLTTASASSTYQPLDADLTTYAGLTPTTIGQNIITLSNPSAVTFPRYNADNTVTARSAANLKTDLSLNNVDNTSDATKNSAVAALTNKDLTSGTNTFPTFNQSTTGTASGSLINVQFLTSGTTYTPTAGTNKAFVILVGGGGGGGGVTGAASSVGAGGGGGGGGILMKWITSISGTYTYALGAAGTAGANTGGTGGNGGNTTFANGATTYTAFGGSGGVGQATGTTAAIVLGGNGAVVSTNGDMNSGGSPGLMGYRISGTLGWSGSGGDSDYGGAGNGLTAAGAGNNATGYGAGGGGALSTANTARAGGTGGAGLIIIYEYK
jgi:hypothetical protein